MKKFVKELSYGKKVLILSIVGAFFTAFSFVYYYAFDNPNNILLCVILFIDLVLFYFNCLLLVNTLTFSKIKIIIFPFLIMISFLILGELLVFIFTLETQVTHSFNMFIEVLKVLIFVSPMFIVLFPLIWFACECLS